MITSQLKDSSDGFDNVPVLDDHRMMVEGNVSF
jgi:hypothetical protein